MQDSLPRDEAGRLWIFGYGSLVWRPAFPHVDRCPARVDGWTRRFWQSSTDHRGVPGAPGRVVTVVESVEDVCWGCGYAVDPEHEDAVLAGLDHREQQGYERRIVRLFFRGGQGPKALMYVATPENPSFVGHAPDAEIADVIASSVGPSGSGIEYLFELAKALRAMGVNDPHVFGLERLVREG